MNIILTGEDAILIYFGDKIGAKLPKIIASASAQLQTALGGLIIDATPSYTSLHLRYDLNQITHQDFVAKVKQCLAKTNNINTEFKPKTLQIPVCYDLEFGLDLERLLAEKQLDLATFIQLHAGSEYQVYALGFSPVFAFLGIVDERIRAPRLKTPRLKVSAGSVGIAESQTAIYPLQCSGGWNIIGRTPVDLSLNNIENIDKFKVGDKVKFNPISKDEFLRY